jgi:predicted PurR-regulated permease PerM
MSEDPAHLSEPAPQPAPVARWLLIGLTIAAVYVCWPLWPALVLAAWTAALARPLLTRFERALRGKRRAAAALSLLLFVVLTLPLVAVVLGTISGAQDLARLLAEQPSAKGALASIAAGPQPAAPQVPRDLTSALELVERHGAEGALLLKNLAGAAASGVVLLLIYFGGAYAFLVHGPEVWTWLRRHSPLPPGQLARFGAAFHETGHGLLIGVGLTSATQGVVATLVYASLGVPRWWVLGPITGLASMIPLVGSALVWAPLAAGFLLSDHAGKAAILLVLGVAVISTADNLLRPFYARLGSLRMPTFLLFVALFGGISAFGAWGALLGPLVVRLWLEALALQREATGLPSKDAVAALEQ